MVIDAINKHSIKGKIVKPLQNVLLIEVIFDISLFTFWVPCEENRVVDAASWHDYSKLANLGLQVSHQQPSIKASTLCQKLSTFFITHSHLQPTRATTPQGNLTNPSVETTTMSVSRPFSK